MLNYSDMGKCMSATTSSCKSISLSNKNLECCIINTHYYGSYYSNYDFDMCFAYTTTKITQSQIESMEQVYRESCGFTLVNMGLSYSDYSDYLLSFRQTYDCKSQNFAIDYKIGSYTEEEKEIFNDEKYCLRLYYQGLIDLNLIPDGVLNIEKKLFQKMIAIMLSYYLLLRI